MPPTTQYSRYLGDLEPVGAIRQNVHRVRAITDGWTTERFERSYGAGKWTARQILTHLAHTEMALGYRARMALSTPDYAAQRFDQDAWITRETRVSGREAVEAFTALARLNAALFEGLSSEERQVPMSHPEYGRITVDWIVHLLAGHQIHHLQQLEKVGAVS
jgi:urease accessory protein UreF